MHELQYKIKTSRSLASLEQADERSVHAGHICKLFLSYAKLTPSSAHEFGEIVGRLHDHDRLTLALSSVDAIE